MEEFSHYLHSASCSNKVSVLEPGLTQALEPSCCTVETVLTDDQKMKQPQDSNNVPFSYAYSCAQFSIFLVKTKHEESARIVSRAVLFGNSPAKYLIKVPLASYLQEQRTRRK